MEIVAESEDEIAVILTKHEFRLLGSYVGGTDSDTVDNEKGLASIWKQYSTWCLYHHFDTTIFDVTCCADDAISLNMKRDVS